MGKELTKKQKRLAYFGWFAKRFALFCFDIFAVNFAYCLALVIRFYVEHRMLPSAAQYIDAFLKFAPYYTVLSILVFLLCRLYSSQWRQSGLNDLNRILSASVITSVIQVAGTMLFVKRMPISYYGVGGVVQFLLIALSRFGYRFILMEAEKLKNRRKVRLNVMIVGTGETAVKLRNQIEGDPDNAAYPVCFFSYWNEIGRLDGLPVLSGVENLKSYLEKQEVRCVLLADPLMPADVRAELKRICTEAQIEVQDFSGFLQSDAGIYSLRRLLESVQGPVRLMRDGISETYASAESVLLSLTGRYSVEHVSAEGNTVVIEAHSVTQILQETEDDWMKKTEQETGEKISFF